LQYLQPASVTRRPHSLQAKKALHTAYSRQISDEIREFPDRI
jgi:hypothetical protein